MGKELEVKYLVKDAAQLQQVLSCAMVEAVRRTPWAQIPMETTYFDTPNHDLSAKRWTLRHRLEGGQGVACLKTPAPQAHARNEYEIPAAGFDGDTLAALVAAGAPQALTALAGETLVKTCGAKFVRQVATLCFPDGSSADLSGDVGLLTGATEQQEFCEMELELKQGQPEAMLHFAEQLAAAFSLRQEKKSKFARASALK